MHLSTLIAVAMLSQSNSLPESSKNMPDPAARKAIECSALFYILTAAEGSERASNAAIMFGEIYRARQIKKTGKSMSNGELIEARDQVVDRIVRDVKRKQGPYTSAAISCNAWRMDIADRFANAVAQNGGNELTESQYEELVLSLVPIRVTPRPSQLDQLVIGDTIERAVSKISKVNQEFSEERNERVVKDLLELIEGSKE